MSDMTPSRVGQVNGGGDVDALFLKVFGGEVLTAFQTANKARSRHIVRTITSGKSAAFPATWKGTASYHTPGHQILGDSVNANERVLIVDDMLIAARAVAQIDELKNHYDIRSIYSTDIGASLSDTYDKNVLRVLTLAARASATVSGGNGGSRVIGSNVGTVVADLEAAIFTAIQKLDEKDIPDSERTLWLKPAQYYLLLQGSGKVINSDYNPTPNGGYATGNIFQIGGVEIVKSNHLPRDNNTSGPTAYRGNFTTNIGLVTHKSAAGTVQLLDLAMEAEWQTMYQTFLMLGKYAVGHGILRPEAAVEIASAATS